MKRIAIYLSIILMMIPYAVSRSQVKYGIKGGLDISAISFSNSDKYDVKNKVGYYIGATALVPVSNKYVDIDASVIFDVRGGMIQTPFIDGGSSYESTLTQYQAVIPVNVRLNVIASEKAKMFVFAGPQINVNIGSKNHELDYGTIEYKPITTAGNAGLGIVLSQHFQITANYNICLTKSGDDWINREVGYGQAINKIRMNSWQLGLAYYF